MLSTQQAQNSRKGHTRHDLAHLAILTFIRRAHHEQPSNLFANSKTDPEEWRKRKHLHLPKFGPTSWMSMPTRLLRPETIWGRLWSCRRRRSMIGDQTSVSEGMRNLSRRMILWLLEVWESQWWEINSMPSFLRQPETDPTLPSTEEIRLRSRAIPLVSSSNLLSTRS